MNVEDAGAVIISGVRYTCAFYAYDAEGVMKYYSKPETKTSTLSTANAPTERTPLNLETLPEGLTAATVDTSTLTSDGISPWGDGTPANLFDGNTTATKIGGQSTGTVTLTFSLTEASTITHYSIYTGGDTATNADRNPGGWILYGKVDGEFVVLDHVESSNTEINGLGAANSTPFHYDVANAQECTEYQIVFYTGGAFQLNELVLYVG